MIVPADGTGAANWKKSRPRYVASFYAAKTILRLSLFLQVASQMQSTIARRDFPRRTVRMTPLVRSNIADEFGIANFRIFKNILLIFMRDGPIVCLCQAL